MHWKRKDKNRQTKIASTLDKLDSQGECLKYKKRLLLRWKNHFKSDLINNMDHMRIWVMNRHQWFLVKQRSLKVDNGGPKVPKQAEAKRDGVINLQSYNFN